jgi:predicted peroxiredoxin
MIVATGEPERFRAGLTLARCEIALGGTARMLLQGMAVTLAVPGAGIAGDARWVSAGEPALDHLLDEALADGVQIVACQSGLAIATISAEQVDNRIAIGGMIGFLAGLTRDERLLML